ncbi:MAG: Superoxide dismutase [Mn/Fe] [Variovorax sp.]|nr:MAG: Superoxide dismutase [Mn/Fe] [Variovorax sp.]
MPYVLPALPYAFDALEPHIDAQTMEIHHGKHHQTYVNNLNAALKDTPHEGQPIEALIAGVEQLPEALRAPVRNNGGGHANHSLFWTVMAPVGQGGGGAPEGELAKAIDADLGGFEAFKEAFTKAALTRFGSGWAWLTVTPAGKLAVESSGNQDSPLMRGIGSGNVPILGLDVWEHAYYLQVPEPPPRIHRGLLQRRELGRGGPSPCRGAARRKFRRMNPDSSEQPAAAPAMHGPRPARSAREWLGLAIVAAGAVVVVAHFWRFVTADPVVWNAFLGGSVAAFATALGTTPVIFSQ